jgi:ketosteroid isomerase-like protein/catechol 2,3-dioxygenase-like lactoylglutathione lyase family enzyme
VSLRNDNLRIVFTGWVDALRRNDLETIEQHVHPDAVWQGLRADLVCGDRAAIVDNVRQNQGWLPDVAGIELTADGDQVLFVVRSPDLVDIAGEPLDEQIFQVFTVADGLIARIDEYRAREQALEAMQLRSEALAAASSDLPRTPPAPVDALIPFVHVADVERSIAFYELLGFAVEDTHRFGDELGWAAVSSGDARLMLARAGEPVRSRDQAVLFYLFTADLTGLQRHLRAHGHRAGAIRDGSPGPSREMRVADPDGYVLMIAEREG